MTDESFSRREAKHQYDKLQNATKKSLPGLTKDSNNYVFGSIMREGIKEVKWLTMTISPIRLKQIVLFLMMNVFCSLNQTKIHNEPLLILQGTFITPIEVEDLMV